MSQLAVSYGANAVPVMGGSADPTRRSVVSGATPAIGSGVSLGSPEPIVIEHIPEPEDRVSCAGITKRGTACSAPVVRGTEWCAGHHRSINKGD